MRPRPHHHQQILQIRQRHQQGDNWQQIQTKHCRNAQGIITSDGQRWQETRRFTLKHLKDFGFGKEGLEGVIQAEAEEITRILASTENRDIK